MKGLRRGIVFVFLTFSFLVTTAFQGTKPGKISLKMESKRLYKGKLVSVKAEIYYNFEAGVMLTRYVQPSEMIFISNAKGEAKIYYPQKNSVSLKRDEILSSENNLLYYFFANKTGDMGLKDLGFKPGGTRFEENLMVVTWIPSAELAPKVNKVEVVYEQYLPIFTAYYGKNKKVSKKIFYSNYTIYEQVNLPLKITEFNYLANGDSTISRLIYSDIKVGQSANSQYFNYSIPSNARIME
jgi:hypothetical protein